MKTNLTKGLMCLWILQGLIGALWPKRAIMTRSVSQSSASLVSRFRYYDVPHDILSGQIHVPRVDLVLDTEMQQLSNRDALEYLFRHGRVLVSPRLQRHPQKGLAV